MLGPKGGGLRPVETPHTHKVRSYLAISVCDGHVSEVPARVIFVVMLVISHFEPTLFDRKPRETVSSVCPKENRRDGYSPRTFSSPDLPQPILRFPEQRLPSSFALKGMPTRAERHLWLPLTRTTRNTTRKAWLQAGATRKTSRYPQQNSNFRMCYDCKGGLVGCWRPVARRRRRFG